MKKTLGFGCNVKAKPLREQIVFVKNRNKKSPNPQDAGVALDSNDLQHHDALQLGLVDACAACGVVQLPDLTALCVPRGEAAISKNAHLFAVPKGEEGFGRWGICDAV